MFSLHESCHRRIGRRGHIVGRRCLPERWPIHTGYFAGAQKHRLIGGLSYLGRLFNVAVQSAHCADARKHR
jgi:hypothetical protein